MQHQLELMGLYFIASIGVDGNSNHRRYCKRARAMTNTSWNSRQSFTIESRSIRLIRISRWLPAIGD
eukprot:6086971-Amphidinium_carterae.1